MEDRAESEKKIKNGAPRVPEEGFGGLPGSPWDGLGRPKGGPEPYFYEGETDDFQEGDQNDVSETKEHDKKEWALVVDKKALQKRPKIIIFDDPPWPKSG